MKVSSLEMNVARELPQQWDPVPERQSRTHHDQYDPHEYDRFAKMFHSIAVLLSTLSYLKGQNQR